MAKTTKAKYAVNVMITMDGRAPVNKIKEHVKFALEKRRIDTDARSNGPASVRITKVTVRSVDED